MISEGELLWAPRREFAQASNLAAYMKWLGDKRGQTFSNYHELWRWSVTDLEGFWGSIWDYFQIYAVKPYERVLDRRVMPGAHWFEGARINYAEHMLRHEARAEPDKIVFHHLSEVRPLATMTWHELGRQVRILATQLRAMGVVPGDRIVSYMPNVPETAIAMLATVAVGAVWSSAAPEFGVKTVAERFSLIQPRIM
ncbi:MAG: acetyl-coenzyme A synthetase N-terminal domain-containing protein, partial [Stenotrophobium sp.]